MDKSPYQSALGYLRHAIVLIDNRKDDIISIQAEIDDCRRSYPCQGHGDAIIIFKNGTSVNVECDSVGMGAIMYYFKKDQQHFTKYIDKEFEEYIDTHL